MDPNNRISVAAHRNQARERAAQAFQTGADRSGNPAEWMLENAPLPPQQPNATLNYTTAPPVPQRRVALLPIPPVTPHHTTLAQAQHQINTRAIAQSSKPSRRVVPRKRNQSFAHRTRYNPNRRYNGTLPRTAQTYQTPAPERNPGANNVMSPGTSLDIGMAQRRQQLFEWEEANQPDGTQAAYSPKELEWNSYCMLVHGPVLLQRHNVGTIEELPPSERNTLFQVDPHKLYDFLWYQAHRKKYKSRKEDTGNFTMEEYSRVVSTYNVTNPPLPENPIGASQVAIYASAIRHVWEKQWENSTNRYNWTNDLFTNRVQKLIKMVRNRAPMIKHATAAEKIDNDLAPYYLLDKLPDIEFEFWKCGIDSTPAQAFSSLRDRFCFNQTVIAILRGESLERADLSDCLDVMLKGTLDHHEQHILVLQIATGKINRDKKLYGRAVRHKNVNLCAVGALALYLYFRFQHTGEMDDPPDFTDNPKWFFRKLLISGSCAPEDMERPMNMRLYSNGIKGALKRCGLPTNIQIHIGRKVGPTILEWEEISKPFIDALGNWNQTQQEESYSACLPMLPIRVAGGYNSQKGSGFCKRQTMPSTPAFERLASQVFPFVDDSLQKCRDSPKDCWTAIRFLTLLKHLRAVLLQDVALMMNDEKRQGHLIFADPLFQSEDFTTFRQEMCEHMATAADPVFNNLEQVLPGVANRFDKIDQSLGENASRLTFLQGSLHQGFQDQRREVASLRGGIANGAMAVAASVGASGESDPASAFAPVAATNAPAMAAFLQALSQKHSTVQVPQDLEQLELMLTEASTPSFQSSPTTATPPSPQRNTQGLRPMEVNLCSPPVPSDVHPNFQELHCEWHGTDRYANKPCQGGFHALESLRGSAWRRNYSNAQKQKFSQIKRAVESFDSRCRNADAQSQQALLEQYNQWWESAKGIRNFTELLVEAGHIERTSRKRKSHHQDSP